MQTLLCLCLVNCFHSLHSIERIYRIYWGTLLVFFYCLLRSRRQLLCKDFCFARSARRKPSGVHRSQYSRQRCGQRNISRCLSLSLNVFKQLSVHEEDDGKIRERVWSCSGSIMNTDWAVSTRSIIKIILDPVIILLSYQVILKWKFRYPVIRK